MFQTGSVTQLKVTDFENVFDSSGSLVSAGTPIVPGDTFQGMYLITNSQTPAGANVLYSGNFQLAGVFQLLVQSTTANVDSSGDSAFTFVPYAPFAAQFGLPAGAMVALWDGPANAFNASAPTWQQAETTATAGTLWEVAGAAPGSVWGSNYYWAAVGSANPGVASFATSLQLLYNNTGVPNGFFSDLQQQAPLGYGPASELNSLFAIANPVVMQGSTSLNTDSIIPFQINSQDPLQENIVVPEPSTAAPVGHGFPGVYTAWGQDASRPSRLTGLGEFVKCWQGKTS